MSKYKIIHDIRYLADNLTTVESQLLFHILMKLDPEMKQKIDFDEYEYGSYVPTKRQECMSWLRERGKLPDDYFKMSADELRILAKKVAREEKLKEE